MFYNSLLFCTFCLHSCSIAKFLATCQRAAMALQWRRAISIVVGPQSDHIDKTQQAPYLQYRGGSWGNRTDKTFESLRARADGDQLIFKGSLLPFDTVSDDGWMERRVTMHLRKLCPLVRSHLLRPVLTSTFSASTFRRACFSEHVERLSLIGLVQVNQS